MNKFVAAYLVGMVLSCYIISGIVFAGLRADFPSLNSIRDCRGHLGFALAWSTAASALWPFFLPGTFVTSGFAYDGIWTKYQASDCFPKEPNQ